MSLHVNMKEIYCIEDGALVIQFRKCINNNFECSCTYRRNTAGSIHIVPNTAPILVPKIFSSLTCKWYTENPGLPMGFFFQQSSWLSEDQGCIHMFLKFSLQWIFAVVSGKWIAMDFVGACGLKLAERL